MSSGEMRLAWETEGKEIPCHSRGLVEPSTFGRAAMITAYMYNNEDNIVFKCVLRVISVVSS